MNPELITSDSFHGQNDSNITESFLALAKRLAKEIPGLYTSPICLPSYIAQTSS